MMNEEKIQIKGERLFLKGMSCILVLSIKDASLKVMKKEKKNGTFIFSFGNIGEVL